MLTREEHGTVVCQVSTGKSRGDLISVDECNEGYKKIVGGEMVLFPTMKYVGKKLEPVRDVVMVCGPSGLGKSTLVADYARKFQKLFRQPIFMISRKREDKAFDGIELNRPIVDERMVTSPIDIQSDDIPNTCLFIFDDYDTFPSAIQSAVTKLLMDILETGRSKCIYCCICSHLLTKSGRKENSIVYNEVLRLVVSARGGNRRALVNMLEKQLGLGKKSIDEVLRKPSKWLVFGKSFPCYLISGDEISIMD